jgi:hypothetical protein
VATQALQVNLGVRMFGCIGAHTCLYVGHRVLYPSYALHSVLCGNVLYCAVLLCILTLLKVRLQVKCCIYVVPGSCRVLQCK